LGRSESSGPPAIPTHPRRIAPAHPGAPSSNRGRPWLAESLRLGDEAAAELAAIPDTPELERADEAIVRANCSNGDDGAHHVREKIARMAELYRSGQHRVDFANAGAFELLAFCVASETEDRNKMSGSAYENSDGAQPDVAIRLRQT
jgi:hypothetical protein